MRFQSGLQKFSSFFTGYIIDSGTILKILGTILFTSYLQFFKVLLSSQFVLFLDQFTFRKLLFLPTYGNQAYSFQSIFDYLCFSMASVSIQTIPKVAFKSCFMFILKRVKNLFLKLDYYFRKRFFTLFPTKRSLSWGLMCSTINHFHFLISLKKKKDIFDLYCLKRINISYVFPFSDLTFTFFVKRRENFYQRLAWISRD